MKVLIQPARLTTPFDWATTIWLATGALALAAAGWVGLRWQRVRAAIIRRVAAKTADETDTP